MARAGDPGLNYCCPLPNYGYVFEPILVWQKCPVCEGRGLVHVNFYYEHRASGTVASDATTTCRTCNGQGVIQ